MAVNNLSVLTSGGLIARNILFNLVGNSIPLGAALVAIPILVSELGIDRFGVLGLAWTLIGYFSIFDLGVGRALTRSIAEKLGAGDEDRIPPLLWTSLIFMFLLGLLGTLLFLLLSPWLVFQVLKVPRVLQMETLNSFYLLAFSLPLIMTQTGLRGALEAEQRFLLINVLKIAFGIFTFLGPLFLLPFTRSLFPIIAVLMAGRVVIWLIYLLVILFRRSDLRRSISIQPGALVPLLRFGSWITVSNLISPLIDYLDRFFIGALLSVSAVAYYVTPSEMAGKMFIVPNAVATVMFPALSTSGARDSHRTALLFSRGVRGLFLILFPLTLIVVTLAHEGLEIWLGKAFAQKSAPILQLLAIGVFLNSLARMPFDLIQSLGRPDLTARLHLLELILYVPALWWMIGAYGILGAAIAWVGRIFLDTLLLFWMALRMLDAPVENLQRMAFLTGAALVILTLGMIPMGMIVHMMFILMMMAAFIWAAWFIIPGIGERVAALNWLKNHVTSRPPVTYKD
jgi:O-antigen/teichoic acid export membrane protein